MTADAYKYSSAHKLATRFPPGLRRRPVCLRRPSDRALMLLEHTVTVNCEITDALKGFLLSACREMLESDASLSAALTSHNHSKEHLQRCLYSRQRL